jgi:F-type H+-transporting ATPase subunit delta
MILTFATHGEVFFHNANNIKQIDVPAISGPLSIIANDKLLPLLASLQPGVVTVHENDGNFKKIFISSGNIFINQDSLVQVIAEEAFSIDKFDLISAQNQLDLAKKAYVDAVDDIDKVRAQIEIDCAEAILTAIKTN